ncbi:hypothetical protein FRB94_009965 [Tulasnella sp. JGI-2019a]|nr:hypothetical protein FRB94_009965 [Tulasnella sp. JGI-2019a]
MAYATSFNTSTGSVHNSHRHVRHYSDQMFFLIEDTLYAVPTPVLHQSSFFSSMIDNIGDSSEGKDTDHPIAPSGIKSFDMDGLLTILDARLIDGAPELTLQQLSGALHLATMWDFDAARKYIIDQITIHHTDQPPLDRIELAMRCQVGEWLHPAYKTLCDRPEPITEQEGERLGYRRLIAICRIREGRYTSAYETIECGVCYYCRNGFNSERCENPVKEASLVLIEKAEELAVLPRVAVVDG